MPTLFKKLLLVSFLTFLAFNLFAANSAVLIMYHRFGDDRYPSTNIRLDQFDAQLAWLKKGGYHVLPVPEIVDRLQSGESLPDKTVGIIIDDGFETVYTNAWPRLQKAGYPFTLFLATDPIGSTDMMTWPQVKELAKSNLVTIGAHTATHPYLERLSPADAQADIARGKQKIIQELGITPTLFAYPYGEYDTQVVDIVKKLGFKAAFAQVSGAIGPQSNFFLLQRFPLNENYGQMDRFKLILQSKSLPIGDLSPADPIVNNNNPPTIRFTVLNKSLNLKTMNCYATGTVAPLKLNLLGNQQVEIVPVKKFALGRTHVNCTLPAQGGGYYWNGMLYIVNP